MLIGSLVTQAVFSLITVAQTMGGPESGHLLPPNTILPIVFTSTLDANRAKVGDRVLAKTIQVVKVPGLVLASGSVLRAHIISAVPAIKPGNKTQASQNSELGLHFDLIASNAVSIALDVYVRAMADPISSRTATEPYGDTKWDSDATVVQVGGDWLTPSQTDVISSDGRVVARNIKGGVYGKLQTATGNSPSGCDASNSDESLAIFSVSACGLYGFGETRMEHSGRTFFPSTLLVSSPSGPARIWKGTTALLEVRQPAVERESR